jgi:16S rRNA G966 N2-methylase RsmD
MKIAYVVLPGQKIHEIENEKGAEFLKEYCKIDVDNYDFVAVYKSEKGIIEYYNAFKIVKEKAGIKLAPREKLKRPVDDIHKFWARKPWWAVSQYILTYSKEGDVICDPMCGSGIAGYEALRTRRRAIMVDLNPFAIFLAKNTIKPLSSEKLLSAYEEVLNRPIDRDITTEDGNIFISKGTPVKDALNYLYKTTCRSCRKSADAVYYIWDTVYEFRGKKPGTDEGVILLEAIASVKNSNQYPREVSQLFLLEKWEDILKKIKELCEVKGLSHAKNLFKGPPRPSIITDAFGKLVREGVYTRIRREPRFLFYRCRENRKHKGLAELNEEDRKLVSEIEKVIIPFPYPKTNLKYPNGKLFDTARPDSVFLPYEVLSTWTQEELANNDEKVYHLFTKRNLLALSILFWSIQQVKEQDIREKLLLAFTETLFKASKLNSYEVQSKKDKLHVRRATLWREPRFSVPPDFSEENVHIRYNREMANIMNANEETVNEIGEYYREAADPDDFILDKSKTILFLRVDSRDLNKIFGKYRDVVSMVFTDPPYGDAIQYFELCTFWTSWLLLDPGWSKTYGDGDWWQKEVVVNPVRDKSTLEHFKEDLIEVFRSVADITTSDATWVVTYHKREPRYWNALMEAQLSIGLGLYSEERHQLLGKSFNPSKDFKFLETDAYTVWKKLPIERIKTLEKAAGCFFEIIESAISAHNDGILTRDAIEKAYVEMAWKVEKSTYEKFFEGKLDSFLNKCTIQIPTKNGMLLIIRRDSPPSGISLTKWQELWDKYYGKTNAESLIKRAIQEYIKGKNQRGEKVSLDDIYSDIISKIDGRITKDTIFKALEEVAEYSWLDGTYKPKETAPREGTLLAWIEIEKEEVKLPEPPENLIPKIAVELIKRDFDVYIGEGYKPPDLSPVYSRKILKKVDSEFKGFPLVFQKQNRKICIDVNTISRASQILLREDTHVIVLVGTDEIREACEKYFKKYIDEGKLTLIDVRGYSTEEVIRKILESIGGK